MENQKLAELLFQLQQATRSINSPFSKAIERAIISTLDCKKPLSNLPRDEILKLSGFNTSNITFVDRIIGGESVAFVSEDVPVVTPKEALKRGVTGPQNLYTEWKRTMKY
ncbi:hypothetical protein [Aromatoleum anaerobium]|uniref:Uncharacterized protein n=1 Tax=Aromatoleum anaerobium TaxID=182180 RepID=A0ABX1PMV8_9RHOO|nr:hypothetical protein [Aromatoleum anaerobium]MCK0505853.1 hypothetical protein [Aromatoleum anaerobium]